MRHAMGAMLDRDAGMFKLAPVDATVPAGRRYLLGTMVLETTWGTATGWIVVRDVLLIGPWHHADQRSTTDRRSPTDSEADFCHEWLSHGNFPDLPWRRCLQRSALALKGLSYKVQETDDGLAGEEGAFAICSFWLVSALAEIGEHDRARTLCEKLLLLVAPRPLRRGDRPGLGPPPGQLPAGLHAPGAHQRGRARHPRRPCARARPAPAARRRARAGGQRPDRELGRPDR